MHLFSSTDRLFVQQEIHMQDCHRCELQVVLTLYLFTKMASRSVCVPEAITAKR